MPEIKSTLGLGSTYIVPTATHSQLGLREWAFGPSIVFTTTAVDKWLIGGLYYQPFSMQSNAYQVLFQPLVIRNLPNQWYVGLGDASWKFDDHKGQYDIPIALRIGKVAKIGKHNWNIFCSRPTHRRDCTRAMRAESSWGAETPAGVEAARGASNSISPS